MPAAPPAPPSAYRRARRRIVRLIEWIAPDESDFEEAITLEDSGHKNLALVGIGAAIVGMTTALVIAYTVGGVHLVKRLGYAGVFLSSAIGSASMFIPVPGSLAGITFGLFLAPIPFIPQPITIGAVVAAGSVLGELTGYSTGVGGRSMIGKSRVGRALVRLMRKHGSATLFCVAAVPNPFVDVGGIAAGVAGMPMRRFIGVMFCGKLVNYTAIAFMVSAGFGLAQRVFG